MSTEAIKTAIPHRLERIALRLPDKPAIVQADDSLSFAEMRDRALATAEVLRQLGVAPGDRVGVCMSKTADQAVAILAILQANAILVPILPKLKADNIEHIVANSGMRLLISDARRIAEVQESAAGVTLVIGHGEFDTDLPSLPYLRCHITDPKSNFEARGEDIAALIYSSGSTGRPKGIMVTHQNLSDGTDIVARYLGTVEEDRICGIMSFNFDYGLNQLWQIIDKGATLYLHEFVFPNDLFSLLSDKRLTVLPVMPVIIAKMFDARFFKSLPGADFSTLRMVCTTGGPVSGEMIENLKAAFAGADIYLMYGLTEAFRSCYLLPDQIDARPGSMGKAIPDVEILVLDEEGRDCPPGVPGELVHRGALVSLGYWQDEAMTAQRFRIHDRFPGETMVFSGDLVKTDEDGYLYFLGRKDAMIKTYGYRVSPTEVEEEANRHDMIQASMVFGIRNVDVTEDIALAYTTRDGEALHQRSLTAFLRGLLPTYMVPRHLIHLAEFPSTGNEGKIDRNRVREAAEAIIAGAPTC